MSNDYRYAGLTLNERLMEAGLIVAFERAVKLNDHADVDRILAEVGCERIARVEVITHDNFLGDVIGILYRRRLQIYDCETAHLVKENARITAIGPMNRTSGLDEELKSLNDGSVTVVVAFEGFSAIEPEFDPDPDDTLPAAAALRA